MEDKNRVWNVQSLFMSFEKLNCPEIKLGQ